MPTFNFTNLDPREECSVVVRVIPGPAIGLAISLRTGGDIEAVIPADVAGSIGQVLLDASKRT